MNTAKHTRTATFSNGHTIKRTGTVHYTHAYMLTANGKFCASGFATSRDLAQHAGRAANTKYQDGQGTVEVVEVVQNPIINGTSKEN